MLVLDVESDFNVLPDNELCYVLPEAWILHVCIYILIRHGWVIELYTHPHFSYTNLGGRGSRGIYRLLGKRRFLLINYLQLSGDCCKGLFSCIQKRLAGGVI